jgi:hypothetical protein
MQVLPVCGDFSSKIPKDPTNIREVMWYFVEVAYPSIFIFTARSAPREMRIDSMIIWVKL